MIIILEGPDGAGKTTLAHELRDRHGFAYHHEGPPPEGNLLEHYGAILDSFRGRNAVIDRLAYGERVYGPILRGQESRFTHGDWVIFQRLMRAVGAIQLTYMPPYNECKAAWKQKMALRQELFEDAETLRRVYREFANIVESDVSFRLTIRVGADELLNALDEGVFIKPTKVLPPGFVGSPSAKFLFVGEKGSHENSPTRDLAFFGTSGCSGYLTYCLHQAGFEEQEIAFINAARWDNQVVSWPELDWKVIALGNKARMECQLRDLEFYFLPHPQYWRRFHNSQTDEYVTRLARVRNS